jgi:hypothetical protein
MTDNADSGEDERWGQIERWLVPGAIIGILVWTAAASFTTWVERMERRHHRGELLAAYKRRHQWKIADIPHLQTLGVNKAAQSRMGRLSSLGRPVVKPHESLEARIMGQLDVFGRLMGPEATERERRRAFRQWPWWKHYVEAFHRHEYQAAKAQHVADASGYAERKVAEALLVSWSTVRAVCVEIRRIRREDPESANFPPMPLAEFSRWMQEGCHPKSEELTEPQVRA